MLPFKRSTLCLGLLAGSLSIAVVAQADIPITTGRATGSAAFFVTNTGGSNCGCSTGGTTSTSVAPILFDTAIQTLRIETPNGTTTNSRFLPTASLFTDVNSNGIPDQGDTGRLEGGLSGVAFTPAGAPVFFQNVPTALDFTLNTFDASVTIPGTLISPQQTGATPLVFLPNTLVTLSSNSQSGYTANFGDLDVGNFTANLTGDFIGLPSDLKFRPVGGAVILPVYFGQRLKFDFKGNNVIPTTADFDPTDGTLAFNGSTSDFKLQVVGAGTQNFKIDGKLGVLDLEIQGPFDLKKNDVLSSTAATNYRVKGEATGFTALLGSQSVDFLGTARKPTDFKFEQGSLKLEGKSTGDVAFTVLGAANSVNFNAFTPFVGPPTSVTTVNTPSSGSSNPSTTSSSFAIAIVAVSTTTYINAFTLTSFGSSGNNTQPTYTIYSLSNPNQIQVEQDDDDNVLVVDHHSGGKGQVVAAYTIIGLPSRIFPGLVGLKQISPSSVQPSGGTTTPGGSTTGGSTGTSGDNPTGGTTNGGTTTPGGSTTGGSTGTSGDNPTGGTTSGGTTTPGGSTTGGSTGTSGDNPTGGTTSGGTTTPGGSTTGGSTGTSGDNPTGGTTNGGTTTPGGSTTGGSTGTSGDNNTGGTTTTTPSASPGTSGDNGTTTSPSSTTTPPSGDNNTPPTSGTTP
ncbi:MAG: hypothetical protein KME16_07595 [Scytolyngbya sp. HA4215-MV1]|jgi:hypothetical protein|nr:hypothetical protein [Scytolyngbya sp. HA4215-MV1]